MSLAESLINEILAIPQAKNLQEHVIVINNDSKDSSGETVLSGDAIQQLLAKLGGAQPRPRLEAEITDQIQVDSGKQRYKFRVNRDEQGRISDLQMEEI